MAKLSFYPPSDPTKVCTAPRQSSTASRLLKSTCSTLQPCSRSALVMAAGSPRQGAVDNHRAHGVVAEQHVYHVQSGARICGSAIAQIKIERDQAGRGKQFGSLVQHGPGIIPPLEDERLRQRCECLAHEFDAPFVVFQHQNGLSIIVHHPMLPKAHYDRQERRHGAAHELTQITVNAPPCSLVF